MKEPENVLLPRSGLRELHLFCGAGGGVLGGILLGHTTVCAVEIEPFCRKVLLQRQRDGILPKFPIWDDVKTFDGNPWRGIVDVVCGGFPCQDISSAGRGAGIAGNRSGLWKEMGRIIGEVRPRFAFVENSPILTSRGLGVILGDLAELGYDAKWGVFSASECGAPHLRKRIWIFAHPKGEQVFQLSKIPSNTTGIRQPKSGKHIECKRETQNPFGEASGIVDAVSKGALPYVCRGHDGVADGLDRTKALGNGQVPAVVKLAWETLSQGLI